MKNNKKSKLTGDCFKSSIYFLYDNNKAKLVHAVCLGTGTGIPFGKKFSHAWCEIGEKVYDNSNNVKREVTKKEWYKTFKPKNIVKYNYDDALINLAQKHNFGPWDDKIFNLEYPIKEGKTMRFIIRNGKIITDKILLEQLISDIPDTGGVIVLSTDVNAIISPESKIKQWFFSKAKTISNRLNRIRIVNKVLSSFKDIAVSIGHFFKGKYVDKNGRIWNEKSFSVEIIGITTDLLNAIAKALGKAFYQESVLVKNFEGPTNKYYLVNTKLK